MLAFLKRCFQPAGEEVATVRPHSKLLIVNGESTASLVSVRQRKMSISDNRLSWQDLSGLENREKRDTTGILRRGILHRRSTSHLEVGSIGHLDR